MLHAEVHKDIARIFGGDPAMVGAYGVAGYNTRGITPQIGIYMDYSLVRGFPKHLERIWPTLMC